MKKFVALFALTVALSAPAWAATKTVTLSVPSSEEVTARWTAA